MKTDSATIVQFGRSAFVGRFFMSPECGPLQRDQSVVVQTERGLETGVVRSRLTLAEAAEPTALRLILRPFQSTDADIAAELSASESSLFPRMRDWLHVALPGQLLLDVERLFDERTALLHGFWDEERITADIAEACEKRFGVTPLFYDLSREAVVEEKEKAGCGKEGCGSSGGSCGTGGCGTGGGCSTGSCSRGSMKHADEVKDYLLGMRERMEKALERIALN